MKIFRSSYLALCVSASLASFGLTQNAHAASPSDLTRESNNALQMLLKTNPGAASLALRAKAVLIFPNIIKAGLVFGGAYGEGVLERNNNVDAYYNSVTASWGLQAGAQSYGYVVFLMNQKAVHYVNISHGWEIGTGPSVVVVNDGVAENLSSSTLRHDAYAFIFDQQGLMATLSIEGTKITRIANP